MTNDITESQPASNDSSRGESVATQGQPSAGLALAMLNRLASRDDANQPLGPESVPREVLILPLDILTELVVRQVKKCNRRPCDCLPPSLIQLKGMRRDVIRTHRALLYKAMWKYGNHRMIASVRQQVLEREIDLADLVSSQRVLLPDLFSQSVMSVADGPQRLASVLWALGVYNQDYEGLFRALVTLTMLSKSTANVTVAPDARLKEVEAQLKLAQRERKVVDRQLSDLRALGEGRAKTLRAAAERVPVLSRELEDERKRVIGLSQSLEGCQAELAMRMDEHERLAEIATSRKKEVDFFRRQSKALDQERSEKAMNAAWLRRELERWKMEFNALPKGADAAFSFLRLEEERISANKLIAQAGEPRAQAERDWAAFRRFEAAFLELYPIYKSPRPRPVFQKRSVTFRALGGGNEVGRSCYLLTIAGKNVLVDCGIKASSREDLVPDLDSLSGIDCLILTHAHADHVGWVPALVNRFGEFDIYTTGGTAALLPIVLEDCYQHMSRKLAVRNERARYSSAPTPEVAPYTKEDIQSVHLRTLACDFGTTEQLPIGDLSLTFFRAGHIMGAASVLVEDKSGRRVFFSGDVSSFDQLTVGAAEWPCDLGELDLFVLESTYGGRPPHPPRQEACDDLIEFIRKTVAENGGSVILASFALGRAQELIKLVTDASRDGRLPKVPIFVDGLINRITPVYRGYTGLDIPDELITEVQGASERRDALFVAQKHGAIIITTSGMLLGGPVVEYARQLLPDARNRLVLTGYQDEGAPSQALKEVTRIATGRRRVELTDESGDPIVFEAALAAKEVSLSSHADHAGLVSLSSRISARTIALVHGDPTAQDKLKASLAQLHPRSDIITCPHTVDVD